MFIIKYDTTIESVYIILLRLLKWNFAIFSGSDCYIIVIYYIEFFSTVAKILQFQYKFI